MMSTDAESSTRAEGDPVCRPVCRRVYAARVCACICQRQHANARPCAEDACLQWATLEAALALPPFNVNVSAVNSPPNTCCRKWEAVQGNKDVGGLRRRVMETPAPYLTRNAYTHTHTTFGCTAAARAVLAATAVTTAAPVSAEARAPAKRRKTREHRCATPPTRRRSSRPWQPRCLADAQNATGAWARANATRGAARSCASRA
jgi:hypothetical protein